MLLYIVAFIGLLSKKISNITYVLAIFLISVNLYLIYSVLSTGTLSFNNYNNDFFYI